MILMSSKKEQKSLVELEEGQAGKIVSVQGGRNLLKRLADLGLNEGAEIRLIGKTLFTGPVQVEICNSRFVIGRGMASRITVIPE
jgi:ferrous iron transport protein A